MSTITDNNSNSIDHFDKSDDNRDDNRIKEKLDNLYKKLLGRCIDDINYQYYKEKILKGTFTIDEIESILLKTYDHVMYTNINKLFNELLCRDIDTSTMINLNEKIKNKTLVIEELKNHIVNLDEYKKLNKLNKLFNNRLGRNATRQEILDFNNRNEQSKNTVEIILKEQDSLILDSVEYIQLNNYKYIVSYIHKNIDKMSLDSLKNFIIVDNNKTNLKEMYTHILNRMYKDILNRNIDKDGLTHYLDVLLKNKINIIQIKKSILKSKEFKQNINSVFIKLLNREIDNQAYNHYSRKFNDSSYTFTTLTHEIMESNEYKNTH